MLFCGACYFGVSHLMNTPVKNENDIQILHPKKWVVILFTMLPIIGIGISYAIDSYAWPYFNVSEKQSFD
jgi:hypothetical protein